jgi:uncharacterized protein (TIGR02284 family)
MRNHPPAFLLSSGPSFSGADCHEIGTHARKIPRPPRIALASGALTSDNPRSGEISMDKDAQVTTLNTLTTTLIDSINGYQDAAENSDNSRFQQIFRERADERSRIAEDLRSEVRRLGGEPPTDGSFMGKTHQSWLDLKAAITGRDDKSVINSVEAGEDYLKEKFETALDSGELTGEERQVVERAYQSVRSGHDQISQLKHGMETHS